ncbi:hypothetical protein NA57DRAFT_56689 [Rhizodiscina lignyota]|uniref:Phytanoyl-CoA dioxygenase n=1 Tax=Rhizodiscina lignyota TaxID=1504668 RepID=A0A9P4IGW9_9PEZI|nr:hypothetical protein NA57DRAFT_56689 [Rhizodiscina lignyota]
MTSQRKFQHLTEEQVDSFMKHGFLRIPNCFSPEKAEEWTSNVWKRLGMSPTDKSTWTQERINMPSHRTESTATFAPKAWDTMCELLGGEDRIAPESGVWQDSLIVNLGSKEFEGREPDPRGLPGWHVDGDFFMHFLDSPEQGLLVIPLFTDIEPSGGGTVICSDGMPVIAKHLYEHTEGVYPRMVPRGEKPKHEGLGFFCEIVSQCHEFHEMTGKTGDVILMHPLMLHSASRNSLRNLRIITNPPVALKQPFNFNRENPEDYSLVELKTLAMLGKDQLEDWKITGTRDPVVPERIRRQAEMKQKELERLKAASLEAPRVTALAV